MAKRKRKPRKFLRKRRTRAHIIADLSINFVERRILECGFAADRTAADYGVDLVMTTYDKNGLVENGDIMMQLKATDHLEVLANEEAVAFRLDFRDLNYWLQELLPFILVVYDACNDQAFWLYLQQHAGTVGINDDGEHVTVHIPKANSLTAEAMRRFREFKEAIVAQWKGAVRHAP